MQKNITNYTFEYFLNEWYSIEGTKPLYEYLHISESKLEQLYNPIYVSKKELKLRVSEWLIDNEFYLWFNIIKEPLNEVCSMVDKWKIDISEQGILNKYLILLVKNEILKQCYCDSLGTIEENNKKIAFYNKYFESYTEFWR